MKKILFILLAVVLALSVGLIGCTSTGQQEEEEEEEEPVLPSSLVMAANPSGTSGYARGAGIASIVSKYTPIEVIVQPYEGSSTFIPLVDSGEVDLCPPMGIEMGMAWAGADEISLEGRNPYSEPLRNLRLVWGGTPVWLGVFTRLDTGLTQVSELVGRPVAGDYPAHFACYHGTLASLSTCGLGWEDVDVRPVSAVTDGFDALKDGRVDAALHNVVSGAVQEADAAVGIRLLSCCHDEDALELLQAVLPGYGIDLLEAGSFPGVLEDTYVPVQNNALVCNKDVSDDAVKAIIQALWDHNEELQEIHVSLDGMGHDTAVMENIPIPYHPAAVELYKELGVWTSEAEEMQNQLLAS